MFESFYVSARRLHKRMRTIENMRERSGEHLKFGVEKSKIRRWSSPKIVAT